MAKLQARYTFAPPLAPMLARMECRWCGNEMKVESVTKHAFSEVEYWNFVCACGAHDSSVVSTKAFHDN